MRDHGKDLIGVGDMTYDDWKGNTGPGALLRDIIKTERNPEVKSDAEDKPKED